MILVDGARGSHELIPYLTRLGMAPVRQHLSYGDFNFEGKGPTGPCYIGIERKTLHDILHCIDDARYAGHQRGGMKLIYKFNFLAIEGLWRAHYPDGWLMQGYKDGGSWGYCNYRSRTPLYSKLFNYLISVALSGVPILMSRDIEHTACNIKSLYEYFQKKWDDHTSLLETQVMPLAGITGRPSLIRRWASQLEGIGVKLSENCEDVFSSGIQLATADETEWIRVSGISAQKAMRAVAEIRSTERW